MQVKIEQPVSYVYLEGNEEGKMKTNEYSIKDSSWMLFKYGLASEHLGKIDDTLQSITEKYICSQEGQKNRYIQREK
ncbi:hypothetical protein I7I53_02494 [Histoplasma capsulatum var. duboisii H88]|uniref:Uncharacterized protein n=1 Tax=Ajellomyces capsulatus (strain H88) TaxID=544711 RepID=A0A8A1LLG0_AJEC8|nr:hypothetical protein I7I53_02494 [Histoplasma capsulatum var. duboisii H88]